MEIKGKIFGDYHTHTKASDGFGTVRLNVESAIKNQMKEVAITEHGPRNLGIHMTWDKYMNQKKEIEEIRKEYPNIKIYFGVEADILNNEGLIDVTEEQKESFELLVAGFHRFAMPYSYKDFLKYYLNGYFSFMIKPSKSVIKENTRAMINAVKKNKIDVLAHINNYSIVDPVEVAKACADYGTYMELNSKHIDLSLRDFENMLKTDVLFIANTDAHRSERVGEFSRVADYLKDYEIGDRLVNYLKIPVFRSKK